MPRFLSSSIVARIVAIVIALIFVSIGSVVVAVEYKLRAYVMGDAAADAFEASRAMALLYNLADPASKVEIRDGRLQGMTGEGIVKLDGFDLVDRTAQSIGGVATIFEKQGNDYVRVSTNVKKQDGSRAVGTKLAADHPAQATLARGEAYYGPAELFGKQFMTGYYPVKSAAGANVGILFIGIPMELYFEKVSYLQQMVAIMGAIVMAVTGILGYLLIRRSIKPLIAVTGSVHEIAGGNLGAAIPGLQRQDEFGGIARALQVFRDEAIAKRDIEGRSEQARDAADGERRRNDAEKQALDSQIEFAVGELAAGLNRLAQGDLTRRIDTPFTGRLEQLRQDFNVSLDRLRETLVQIRENASAIQQQGAGMMQSAGELSRRTESQAASLEETAAAVDEITMTVRSAAERAREANQAVTATKTTADNSGDVVRSAIAAMSRIEEASGQIEQIIDVIDDIAFQTNLLALNAGIEAARAGEAGKGFAVVAQEVRELAQRSADAARQIKELINKSTVEVSGGSKLVLQTGEVLSQISVQIASVSAYVGMIATASQDQATALQEVNGSVNAMDQMTQKNAAMVEEATAASQSLSSEADQLMALIERFAVETGRPGYARAA